MNRKEWGRRSVKEHVTTSLSETLEELYSGRLSYELLVSA
jgi:hypothetical protein